MATEMEGEKKINGCFKEMFSGVTKRMIQVAHFAFIRSSRSDLVERIVLPSVVPSLTFLAQILHQQVLFRLKAKALQCSQALPLPCLTYWWPLPTCSLKPTHSEQPFVPPNPVLSNKGSFELYPLSLNALLKKQYSSLTHFFHGWTQMSTPEGGFLCILFKRVILPFLNNVLLNPALTYYLLSLCSTYPHPIYLHIFWLFFKDQIFSSKSAC